MTAESGDEQAAARSYARSQDLVDREAAAMGSVHKIRFYPFVPIGASGTRIWDVDGNEYLDLIAAAGVLQTGTGTPPSAAPSARSWTAPTAMLCTYPAPPTIDLAERLCESFPATSRRRHGSAPPGRTPTTASASCCPWPPGAAG